MKIKLRVNVVEEIQANNGWNESDFAKQIGVSRSRLWRAKLQESHPEYCAPGELFIAKLLNAFPDKNFDDFFIVY